MSAVVDVIVRVTVLDEHADNIAELSAAAVEALSMDVPYNTVHVYDIQDED